MANRGQLEKLPSTQDYMKVANILNQNKNKSFVKRILFKEDYPTLDLGGGQTATHKMAWANVDGKYRVFPTVLFDEKNKQLKALEPNEAYKHIMKTGNFIDFDKKDDAKWFSKNYKVYWK